MARYQFNLGSSKGSNCIWYAILPGIISNLPKSASNSWNPQKFTLKKKGTREDKSYFTDVQQSLKNKAWISTLKRKSRKFHILEKNMIKITMFNEFIKTQNRKVKTRIGFLRLVVSLQAKKPLTARWETTFFQTWFCTFCPGLNINFCTSPLHFCIHFVSYSLARQLRGQKASSKETKQSAIMQYQKVAKSWLSPSHIPR